MKVPLGMMELTPKAQKRKEKSISHYNEMKEAQEDQEAPKPYYFGSNYSNSFYVCNFLMRLFPFSHIAIELQGGLDNSDRFFYQLAIHFKIVFQRIWMYVN